jgi:hypothetical protein
MARTYAPLIKSPMSALKKRMKPSNQHETMPKEINWLHPVFKPDDWLLIAYLRDEIWRPVPLEDDTLHPATIAYRHPYADVVLL